MEKPVIPNVLADRYASTPMVKIWAPENKVRLSRRLWVAVLKAQRELGLIVPSGVIEAYERAIEDIDLAAIAAREFITKHDVKANVEVFHAVAGMTTQEWIHRGMTARDSTDNVEQLQIRDSLVLLRDRTVAVLHRLMECAKENISRDLSGRTHNIPAQTTTLGKRFANIAEELMLGFARLETFIASYPLRGIKGPVGTQQDMVHLLGSAEKALALEDRVREFLGFGAVLTSVGQVYPRSLDFAAVSILAELASSPANLAKNIRLMAGHGLMSEEFNEERVGSSAMPHKINPSWCDRVSGLMGIMRGHLAMLAGLLGDQWYEGDVSCSAPRRVALPDAFFTLDGIYETTLTILGTLRVFPEAISRELTSYLPFLSSTALLVQGMARGLGREEGHRLIKKHAVAAIQSGDPGSFATGLAGDEQFPLNLEEIQITIATPNHGLAVPQVEGIVAKVLVIEERHPSAWAYEPEPIR